jgi:integrase
MKPANPFYKGDKVTQGQGLWVDGYKKEEKPNGHIKDYSISSCWWRKEDYIKRYAPYKPGDILWVRETWRDRWEWLMQIMGQAMLIQ